MAVAKAPSGSGLILLNDDTCSLRQVEGPHTVDSLDIPLRDLAGTQVGAICWYMGGEIAYSWPSKVMENYYDKARDQPLPQNAMMTLHRRGIDYLPLLIGRARQVGIKFFGSFRMNDCHHRSDVHGVLCSQFWKDHQEMRIWEADEARAYYNTTLDYSHPQVRQRKLDIIHETLQWYDMDGIELDFCREPFTFAPSQGWDKRQIMTNFIAQVRRHLNEAQSKWGRPLKLLLRVPFDGQKLREMGMDIERWLEQQAIDILIMSRWFGNDYNQTLEPWLSRCRANDIPFYPSIEWGPMHNAVHNHFTQESIDEIVRRQRAMAQNYLGQGAAGVYMFNYPCLLYEHPRTSGQFKQMTGVFDELGRMQTLAGKAKEYAYWDKLPMQVESRRPAEYRQTIRFNLFDPDLAKSETMVQLNFRQATEPNPHMEPRDFKHPDAILPPEWVTYWLNGQEVPQAWIQRQSQPAGPISSGFKLGEHEKIILTPPASAMKQGENTLGFFILRFPEEHDPHVQIYELKVNVNNQDHTGESELRPSINSTSSIRR